MKPQRAHTPGRKGSGKPRAKGQFPGLSSARRLYNSGVPGALECHKLNRSLSVRLSAQITLWSCVILRETSTLSLRWQETTAANPPEVRLFALQKWNSLRGDHSQFVVWRWLILRWCLKSEMCLLDWLSSHCVCSHLSQNARVRDRLALHF